MKKKLIRILINFGLYNVPLFCLTALVAYSKGMSVKESLITASITFFTALVDVMRKLTEEDEKAEG